MQQLVAQTPSFSPGDYLSQLTSDLLVLFRPLCQSPGDGRGAVPGGSVPTGVGGPAIANETPNTNTAARISTAIILLFFLRELTFNTSSQPKFSVM